MLNVVPDLSGDSILYGDLVTDPTVSSAEQLNRLAEVVAALRAVLNDPGALMQRAAELLDGTAKPLFALAVVGLTAIRMVCGPATPGYFDLGTRHRAAVVALSSVTLHERTELA